MTLPRRTGNCRREYFCACREGGGDFSEPEAASQIARLRHRCISSRAMAPFLIQKYGKSSGAVPLLLTRWRRRRGLLLLAVRLGAAGAFPRRNRVRHPGPVAAARIRALDDH